MVHTRAQKARQEAHSMPVEQGQRPGQELEQGTGKQPEQRRASESGGLNTETRGETSARRKVQGGQIMIIKETHDPVQSNQPRITAPSAEDTIDKAENSDPIRLWINGGRWTGNRFVESEMANHEVLRDWTPSDSGTHMTGISATKSQTQRGAYASPSYETQLNNNDCYLDDSELGVAEESKVFCKSMLELGQTLPEHSLFSDEVFAMAFKSLKNQNDAEIIQDIGQLMVPRAKTLAIQGANHLKILEQSANKGWKCSIPLVGPCPQPDYCVGFNKKAFTETQLTKLSPFLDGILEGNTGHSFFTATPEILFPFLACEVKSGTGALETSDRQNAHSMTLAVRGIVLLFCLVDCQRELNRKILAFSISHDSDSARIYGHYPVFDESGAFRYFRHEIAKFFLAGENGKNRWTAYQFTKNIYDVWMPEHLKRIQSAIDQFPDEWAFNAPKLSYVSSAARKLRALAERGEVHFGSETRRRGFRNDAHE